MSCSNKEIRRVAYSYTRKNGTKVSVPSTCIMDKGKPGKGIKLFTIPKEDIGLLADAGYALSNNHDDRVKSIKKSLKTHDKLKILRHINALRTLNKSNKKYYDKLDRDMKWIQSHYDEL